MKTTKSKDNLNFFCPPPRTLNNYLNFLLMTSHHDCQSTTYVKPKRIPGVQSGNGILHDKYNIHGIAHACTNKKDDTSMQRQLYIDNAHTALNIFCTQLA